MKTIPAALQTHLDQDATTWCLLLKIECVGVFAGTVLGFTNLDRDIVYDDGAGSLTYRADNGFTPERVQMTADLSVDNTELKGWVTDTGITEQQIRAGLFDYAKVTAYRVNYLDLSAGHEIYAVGTCGETVYSATGWRVEFRSLVQQLKQTVSKLYSLRCRARFGSKPIGTNGPQPEERHPCGKDWVWVSATVTDVSSTEPDRIFMASSLSQSIGHFVPGVVRFTSGQNAGREMEVDAFASAQVTLSLPLSYPISVGDAFQIRQDCGKTFAMCKDRFSNTLNFRGEHLIPVADGVSNMVPGAQTSRTSFSGGGGTETMPL